MHTIYGHATGWSIATVFYHFFLTGTKKQKNPITQWFLQTLYMDILIFWCFRMVQRKKLLVSGLCQNNFMAPYCKDWNPKYPSNMSECLQFRLILLRYPQTPPRRSPNTPQTSPGNSRYQQTTTDDIRHLQTPSDTDRCYLSVSYTQPWNPQLFSLNHSETSKYINVHIKGLRKSLGYGIFLFFSACQKEILKDSCKR